MHHIFLIKMLLLRNKIQITIISIDKIQCNDSRNIKNHL